LKNAGVKISLVIFIDSGYAAETCLDFRGERPQKIDEVFISSLICFHPEAYFMFLFLTRLQKN
jgi:hypothetical protein